MTSRAFVVLVLLAIAVPPGAGSPDQPGRAKRVVLLSVDAGADWIVDDLIARGKAPAFARLARDGAVAEAMTTVLPTLTAVAHTSLWTGALPSAHGITGNRVLFLPRADHTMLEWRSGFENHALRAEPIWITAARAGRRVLVPQATGGFPFTNQFPGRLLQFDIYANCQGEIEIVDGHTVTGGPPFDVGAGSETVSIVREPGTGLAAGVGRTRVPIPSERSFTTPIGVASATTGAVRLRLLTDDPATGRFTLLRGRLCTLTSSSPAELEAFRAVAGTIVGEGVVGLYARGRFGRTLAQDGDGQAETLVAEILEANQTYFNGAVSYAARRPWDLLVLYVPNLDAALHVLGGMLDESSGVYSAALARRVQPWLDRLFSSTVDSYVADLRKRFPDATLIVAADHGMEGASRLFFPNVTLRKAGLLSLTESGEIDLGRTRVAHLPGQGGGLFVNTTDRKGGIVPVSELDLVKKQTTAALFSVRDPLDGAAPVRAVFDREIDGTALGFGGDGAADLIFDLGRGFGSSTGVSGDQEIRETPPTGIAEHGGAPWHRNLHAIFYAVGPGVRAGTRLGVVRIVDVAPTVAALLGIPAPQSSIGLPLPLR